MGLFKEKDAAEELKRRNSRVKDRSDHKAIAKSKRRLEADSSSAKSSSEQSRNSHHVSAAQRNTGDSKAEDSTRGDISSPWTRWTKISS